MSGVSIPCPHCRTEMIQGYLEGPVDTIHIASLQSLKDSPLQVLICPACGHVELQATYPEDLARHDLSDKELDALSGEERF